MKVSGQGKLEFESDLSKMLIKLKKNDFAKTLLTLLDGFDPALEDRSRSSLAGGNT